MFSGLRHLEINGCDLSTAAAKGLLDLKPRLETLTCIGSTVRIVLERTFCGCCWPWETPYGKLKSSSFKENSKF
jgi:hypothetical protein